MGIFSGAKDRLVEQGALSYLNGTLLPPYGRATSLRINSNEKTISIEAELKGESAPLQIEISDYELTEEGEKFFATVKTVRTSREWLTVLASNEFCNRRWEVPPKIGRMLMRAL